jgi:murein DD-endopeptidase MepM/ murein hydrolase activator NlpD
MEKTTSSRRFNLISWVITLLIVFVMAGFAFWKTRSVSAISAPAPAPAADPTQSNVLPTPAGSAAQAVSLSSLPALDRDLTLKTIIPQRPRYAVVAHTVERGDSIFRISKSFDIKPETLLWANYDALEDDPHSLKPGQELFIPPTDGIIYKWKSGDSLDKIAATYNAKLEDILNWPGNELDLTNPAPKVDQLVMIPGGWRESKAITLPVDARRGSGSSGSTCGAGGPVGSGFIFPTANHFVSGNDYFPGHLGLDLAAGEGDPIYASAAGVVVKAASGWNGGYGNVVAIDHGNGYVTLYAHLSQLNVSLCQGVGAGQVIGLAGNTGNSFGAHLHFEVRQGGGNINPWYVLQ